MQELSGRKLLKWLLSIEKENMAIKTNKKPAQLSRLL